MSAFTLIYLRDGDKNPFPLAKGWLKEDMAVGLLNIAVQELHLLLIFQRKSQAGSY